MWIVEMTSGCRDGKGEEEGRKEMAWRKGSEERGREAESQAIEFLPT